VQGKRWLGCVDAWLREIEVDWIAGTTISSGMKTVIERYGEFD